MMICQEEDLSWRVADKSGLTTRLEPFLTNSGLELFAFHGWRRVVGVRELWRRLRIYTEEETMNPHFYAYLDSCIINPPHEYDYMHVWGHARGTYVFRINKESALRSSIYWLIHRLVTSTICHCEKCVKVPSGDLFYMWCLTEVEICLHLPFSVALYLSSMSLGSMPSIMICRGYWVTRFNLSYVFDTSGMIPLPLTNMGATALGKKWLLWRVPDEDTVEPIRQMKPKHIPEPAFERRQRPRHAEPNQTESTICDVMWCMDVVGGASLYYGFVGPAVPPHAQPSHDGAGPSGIHHGDTDDNSKESTEDEEGEYESSDKTFR
uniref:Uncharacterized protein n=1 Tax=Lactuca sativa TaxID=4236 RepID=A0A9R1VJ10_LACSA|nr:hypothetical protein LSAT_V11C500231410 [Lactuca sativa]